MERILKLVLIISLVWIMANVTTTYASNDVNFENFDFTINKIREHGKTKVRITFSWSTDAEILISSLETKISGKVQQTNEKPTMTKKDNKFNYKMDYDVQNWQIGTLELTINYFLLDKYGDILSKTFYIPGGKWVKDDLEWGKAFSIGIFITGLVLISTYVIIENSKKGFADSEQEE